jgi:hypothetical protein
MDGNVACMEEMKNTHTSPVRKLEGKGQHVRPRRQAGDNVKLDQRKKWRLWTGFISFRIRPSGRIL